MMKKLILSIAVICSLATLTFSCAKDDMSTTNNGSTATSSSNTFKAKLNGSTFSPNLINTSSTETGVSVIGASSTSGKAVGIELPITVVPGSYPTSTTGDYRITYVSEAAQNNNYSTKDDGTIVITSHNTTAKIIKGTFTGTARHTSAGPANDSIVITAGEFVLYY